MIDRLIPYSVEVYQGLFTYYYQVISPVHILALGIGIFLVVLHAKHSPRGGLIGQVVIATLWIWNGVVFHNHFLIDLNWAAQYFGYAFIVQGVLIAAYAFMKRGSVYKPEAGIRMASCALIVLGMTFSPTLAALLETPISHAHLFGVTPLTVILAGIGTWLASYEKPPLVLMVIPVLWTVWEVLTAENLGLWSDAVFAGITLLSAIGVVAYTRNVRH